MITQQTCAAVLIGTPDVPLSLRDDLGRVSFDDASAPHVEADITIAFPSLATLALIDPRQDRRVRITVTDTGPLGTVTRTFDLGLRGRVPNTRDATLTLTLASDEALAMDYAPIANDPAAYARMTSLRSIINYTLDKAVPGAVLEAFPAHDADVTALDNATNLSPNGGFRQNMTGWTTGAPTFARVAGGPGVDGITYYLEGTFNGGGGGWFNIGGRQAAPTEVAVRPGTIYRSAAWVWVSVATSLAAYIEWGDGNVNFVGQSSGEVINVPANTWTKLTIEATAPVGATRAGAYFYRTAGTWPANTKMRIAGHRFSEKPTSPYDLFQFFDGDTIDTAAYTYDWVTVAGASPMSKRFNVYGRSSDLLLWEAGQNAMEFLMPLVQYAGYRLVCDEQRRWTLRSANYVAPGSIAIRDGINLQDGGDTINRDSDIWHDAAVAVYTWTDSQNVRQERLDSFQLVTPPKRVKRFNFTTPYPGPGFAEYAVRRAQGRGREVTATIRANWEATAEQATTIVLNGAPTQTGRAGRLIFDLGRNEITVTARTADTIPGAIDLLAGTINALPNVTINNL